MAAALAFGGDAFDLAARDIDRQHRHMTRDVGTDDQALAVGSPIADVRPGVEIFGHFTQRAARHIDQRQRWADHDRR